MSANEEYRMIEVDPDEVKIVAERKRVLLVQVGEDYIVVFKDKLRKFRNRMEDKMNFYVSAVKVKDFRWEWVVGIRPIPAPPVWKVIAVHKEKFTPVPHRLLIETLRETLEELGVENPQIQYVNRRWRTFIAWKNGNTGIAIAHKNTAEKGIWIFPYISKEFIPTDEIITIYHTGTIENLIEKVRQAIREAYARYSKDKATAKWKTALNENYTHAFVDILLSKMMTRAPQYVKRYLLQLLERKKVDGSTLLNTLMRILEEQNERTRPNKAVLEATWEALMVVLKLAEPEENNPQPRGQPPQRKQSPPSQTGKQGTPAEQQEYEPRQSVQQR